ncbi:adenine phosphoribosyltransferase [Aquimarina sp. EL_43]|uniref:adenine phosphoribosyltransferase n=1 Tax=Aquimarina TaxID=290174 RepID=UPI0004708AB7|nr:MULTISPECIES: adenine phosphoribosyltransferase [Aquimarina]MBG6130979.1 adenine phosphoribosyltransferase [Aquimarina sp. EL_35]MBG6151438.1 adenine phosphoribosyltransferase [Aquimarina sp. EL_32]MBG6169369.1 adenine phosphoribosyltransferase [Aquimarina sp. EL_43]
MNLQDYIRDISDFPKPGILFKDITPLLANHKALVSCADQLVGLCPDGIKIDKVIGIEARGFIIGSMIAERLQAGFIPVRKKGKLPYDVKSKSYGLEYGEDTLEIHIDAIKAGEHVLIHDDVLATGGTAKAVCDLVKELGGVVVQCNFIMELEFLNGKDKLDVPRSALLKY